MAAGLTWKLAHGQEMTLGARSVVMGILNVTPDSFSDGGRFTAPNEALEQTRAMVAQGADIIDVGGESTRPGADAVGEAQEQDRVLPVIEALARHLAVVISVDTYRASTARLAVQAGAHIVNDVWGLQKEPAIARVAAQTGAGLVIMHTGRERERHYDALVDQDIFLSRSLEIAAAAGVAAEQIVLDPGFGFAKDVADNLDLIARFGERRTFSRPWLVGTSRKRFLGALTGREAAARDAATAATSVALRLKGAAIFRVHDVVPNIDALKIADAILAAKPERSFEHECTSSD